MIVGVSRLFVSALIVGGLCLGVSASAQSSDESDRVEQRSLTEADLRGFIAAYPDVAALGRQVHRDWTGGLETMPLAIGADTMAEMDRTVQAHGFADFTDWVQVAQSVLLAYGFVTSGMTEETLQAQTEAFGQQMRATRGMSEARKQEMAAMMEESVGALLRVQPPRENIELVRGMLDELEPIVHGH